MIELEILTWRIGIVQLIVLIIWTVISLFLSGYIAFYTYQYYKVKDAIVLRKRYPQIAILTAIIGIFLQFRGILFQVGICFRTEDNWIDFVHTFFYPINIHAMMFCFVWRYWMIYYKFNWIATSQNGQWLHYLNQNVCL